MSETPCVSFVDVFKPADIRHIVALGEAAQPEKGKVNGAAHAIRDCEVVWLDDKALSARLWGAIQDINQAFFRLDLDGLERMQYTVYRPGGKYDWHMDKGPKTQHPRKLSITVQLSSPDDYEGGDFHVWTGHEPEATRKSYGAVICFPSWIIHRVEPVTKGIRRSLVAWAYGPAFR